MYQGTVPYYRTRYFVDTFMMPFTIAIYYLVLYYQVQYLVRTGVQKKQRMMDFSVTKRWCNANYSCYYW